VEHASMLRFPHRELARCFWPHKKSFLKVHNYGVPFVKILYLTDLAQKLLSLCRDNYIYLCAFTYLCAQIAISARI